MIAIFAILMLATSCLAHITYNACPAVYPMQDYDAAKSIGKWYEIKRYRNPYETSEKCSSNNATLLSTGSVIYTIAAVDEASGQPMEYGGTGTSLEDDTLTQSKIEFTKHDVPVQVTLTVLDTDYSNYQVRTACRVVHGRRSEVYAWIESRQKTLDPELLEHAYKVLLYNGLPTSQLEFVEQSC